MTHRHARAPMGLALRLLLLVVTCLSPAAAQKLEDRVVEHTLKNGMKFLFVERHDAPVFTGQVVFRVGGVDEQIGATGLAHMFEHMAFKGTRVIGTRDYRKEAPLLDAMDRVARDLRAERARGEATDPKRVEVLLKELAALQEKHRELVVPDEFSEIYSRNGGSGLNASTGQDSTQYYVSLPANRLELWALMESQRLAEPVLREFYAERDVIAEERRYRVEDDPGGMLYEQLVATAFAAHPYQMPIIGWMSDIRSLTADQARAFRQVYYVPNNAVGALVGDFRTADAVRMVEKYFGALPAGPPPPPIVTVEPAQRGEKRVSVVFDAEPMIMIAYHKPTAPTFDDVVFDVIDGIISSGRTSRLYTSLVKEKRLAIAADTFSAPGYRYPNLWCLYAAPLAPHTTFELQAALTDEIERLKKEPVSARELEKVKNQIEASHIRSLDSNQELASQLAETQAIVGDWRYTIRQREMVARVTPEDIQRVARQYLVPENRTVATLVKADAPGAPAREGAAQ